MRFPHMVQDTNPETGTAALRGIPMIDPQLHTPSRLTFEAQDTVTSVAEPTGIGHGAVMMFDVPVQMHLQKTNRPRGPELRKRCRRKVIQKSGTGGERGRVCWKKWGSLGCGAKRPENGLGGETPVGSEGREGGVEGNAKEGGQQTHPGQRT